MLKISNKVLINESEIEISAIRSQGPGGQNINKVSTGIHLRFDINHSSLPESYKEKLVKLKDSRITKAGIIIIKSQNYRTQEKNKEDALLRLQMLIRKILIVPKKRRKTKPTKSSIEKRIERKKKHSKLKTNRSKIKY